MKLFPGTVTSTETNTRRKTEIAYCFSRDASAAVLKLVDFQWKLGMAVSSDRCRSLKYPYVAVKLKVADPSGQVNTKSIEMTIPQFQNFYRQFKEIAAVIETVWELILK